MKIIKRIILSCFVVVATLAITLQASASEDKGVWVRIDQTFEEGAWQILEHCEGIGLGCDFGDYRALTISPE